MVKDTFSLALRPKGDVLGSQVMRGNQARRPCCLDRVVLGTQPRRALSPSCSPGPAGAAPSKLARGRRARAAGTAAPAEPRQRQRPVRSAVAGWGRRPWEPSWACGPCSSRPSCEALPRRAPALGKLRGRRALPPRPPVSLRALPPQADRAAAPVPAADPARGAVALPEPVRGGGVLGRRAHVCA